MKLRYWLLIFFIFILAGIVTCNMNSGLEPGPWIEGEIIIDSINHEPVRVLPG